MIYIHSDEDNPARIWSSYYGNTPLPSKIIKGENQKVIAFENKCFTYICSFINIQNKAVDFSNTEYLILLCENLFCKGPGTVRISSDYKNDIVIDKFCSFESQSSTSHHFVSIYGNINSTILRGSICNGGNISYSEMIGQNRGNTTLSYVNITNCISKQATAFAYYFLQSPANVSYCNFDKLQTTPMFAITQFYSSEGKVERCNFINNYQKSTQWGLVLTSERLDILDSFFQNNYRNAPLFAASGEIYLYRCNVDYVSTYTYIYTSEMATD